MSQNRKKTTSKLVKNQTDPQLFFDYRAVVHHEFV